MGLLELTEIAPRLACPRCRSALKERNGELRCVRPDCGLGAFPCAGAVPALVDFECSVLDRAALEGGSPGPAPAGRRSIGRVPRPLRAWLKPRNRVAAANVEHLLELAEGNPPEVLVVGGGTVGNGVEALYDGDRARVVAFDIYAGPLVQLVADAHRIPLADASVDAVVVQAVLEHVLDPPAVVAEIHRVLRSGGVVYAETPFLQPVHAGPYDFIRYTASGHRWLFRAFEEVATGPVAGPGSQLLASLDHVTRGLVRSQLAGRLARAAFFWLRGLDRLIPAPYALDDASAFFFLGRRAEHELTRREIVAYYAGAQAGGQGSARTRA